MLFEEVDPKPNFSEIEEEILSFWRKERIFEQSVDFPAGKRPDRNFVFFEGPPTANGKPGIHHLEARAFKDIICRYQTMKGNRVVRKAGWDTHGLPVELEVEKELGISGKPEIEKFGIREFNEKCKQSVWKYKEEWENFTRRIGFWVDLEHPYITYENCYIESVWSILSQIWSKNLLFKNYKVVPHCPRCDTTLSGHEVAQGYKKISEPSIYVKFKLDPSSLKFRRPDFSEEKKDIYFLVWTTTPWTLPANSALAFGPEIRYAKIKLKTKEEYWILAESRLEVIDEEFDLIEVTEGRILVEDILRNSRYIPLFDLSRILSKEEINKNYRLVLGDFVSTAEGTGIVHIAPAFGEDDFNVGKENGLAIVFTVSQDGRVSKKLGIPGEGEFVKEADPKIINNLKAQDLLYKIEDYEHDYPFCWRCSSPLLYYAKESWFIKMSNLKTALLENNAQINWIPDYIKDGRFGEWLRDAKDWALSRERYWGTPLPIWECDCGRKVCIGSIWELKEKAVEKDKESIDSLDLHRPFIDKIKLSCECGGEMTRIKEVIDCWFDSGAMPFAQWHYPFENKDLIDKNLIFPADYISEGIDQTRGWFYTLLAISTLLERGPAFKNVVVGGVILDQNGQKMSKSRGNAVDPWEMIKKYGADATRWYFYTINQCADAKLFKESDIELVVKKLILILWNSYLFFVTYANIDKWEPPKQFDSLMSKQFKNLNILDQWILARLEELKKTMTIKLDDFDIIGAARPVVQFVDDLSTWYIRRSRRRFWKSENDKDKKFAYQTLYHVLITLSKLLSPFMPFIAEKIYKNLKPDAKSVHLESWPKTLEKFADKKILEKMDFAKKIIELGLRIRKEARIKVRQPLGKMEIEKKEIEKEFLEIIKEELNIKKLEVVEKITDGLKVLEGEGIKLGVDTKLTKELELEGIAREIIRQIQNLRKEAGYNVEDKINLFYEAEGEKIKKVWDVWGKYITAETLAKKVFRAKDAVDLEIEKDFGGERIWLGVKK